MPTIFGIILTTGQVVTALTGIALVMGGAYKLVMKAFKLWTAIAKNLGSNGGASLFEIVEQFRNEVKDGFKVQGSIIDALVIPMLLFNPDGHVESVNAAFTRQTGWRVEDLALGSWRLKLSDPDRDEWDDIVRTHATFTRHVTILTADDEALPAHLTARPIVNAGRFLGWRAVME